MGSSLFGFRSLPGGRADAQSREGGRSSEGPGSSEKAYRPPGLTAPQLWGQAGTAEPWPPTSPDPTCPATQGRWPPAALQTPQAGLLAPYHLEGESSVGGSDLAILSRTRMGLSSWCGGSIWAISISVMPSDQMSAL